MIYLTNIYIVPTNSSLHSEFHDLVVMKAMNYRHTLRKTSQRYSSVATDPEWTPTRSTVTRPHPAVDNKLQCFAQEGSHSHAKAAVLRDMGVWLGDYMDADKVVAGLSYYMVRRKYHRRISRGREDDTEMGLKPLKNQPENEIKSMVCAACRSGAQGMIVQQL